jgi:hypothetical protein
MQLHLTWQDPKTKQPQQATLQLPVALGSNADEMPQTIGGKSVSHLSLDGENINGYHATIEESNGELLIRGCQTNSSIQINDTWLPSSTIVNGDRFQIGNYQFQVKLGSAMPGCNRQVGFLFKRRCGRIDPTGCWYCQPNQNNGKSYEEIYHQDYAYYPGFGRYDSWGWQAYANRHLYVYDSEKEAVDFTEGDAEALSEEAGEESDEAFEEEVEAS